MSKNTLIIALGIIPLLLIIILIVAVVMQPKANEDNKEQASLTPTLSPIIPGPEDTIRSFFNLLDTEDYDNALKLLSPRMTKDDTASYLQSFKTWESVKIIDINKAAPLDEVSEPTFLVEFELLIKADTDELIWQNGEQTRFITLAMENEVYKIIEIATSP